ncbi:MULTISPECIES: chemotaxis protein CheW [Leeia]|uniref:Chemotaxis protein CheW n=1 Tax=Leeia aquatica TaxID=2725557 RepID=A0A847S9Z2_9NEIS|nr:chemotaxis protein CheW [Leeia aquatica]NLR76553.1 chemotaxis protein CheW [Leeia aquatica]
MAKRISLREFQERVSQRLQSATSGQAGLSRLGVRIGDQHCLLELTQVSEVVSVPPILEVPLTREWFRGVSNIRGTLYSVTDLSHFLFRTPTGSLPGNRLLLLQSRLIDNAALMVSQIIGLRQPNQLEAVSMAQDDSKPWLGEQFRDSQGVHWQMLHIDQLVRQPEFLQINRYQ